MGNIVKLANAGDSVTWRIKSAETVAGKFGPQVKFTAENGDCLFISEDTAGRQLGRIPLDVANCAGEVLTFSRTENPKGGAPYWNITVADVIDKAIGSVGSKRIPPPPKKPLPFDEESFPPEPDIADPYLGNENLPVRQAGMANLSEPKVAPKAEAKAAYCNAYFDLLGYVRAHSGLKDEVAIQACTATIFIGLKQEGLR